MATEGQGPEIDWGDEPGWIAEEIPDAPEPIPEPAPISWFRWKLGLVLLAVSVVAGALKLPFMFELMRQAKDGGITPGSEAIIGAVGVILEGALSAMAVVLGLGLARRAGLGPFMLAGFDDASGTIERSKARAWKAIGLASLLGLGLGVLIVGASLVLEPMMGDNDEILMPSPLAGLLGSLGAGIQEEVWLRFGMMTLLAWLGMVIFRLKAGQPVMIWVANVLAALLFGAMHLPQAALLLGLNAALVTFVLIGNGVPGIVFGWLFWRRGLVAAMIAHFLMDVVLKVILPAAGV